MPVKDIVNELNLFEGCTGLKGRRVYIGYYYSTSSKWHLKTGQGQYLRQYDIYLVDGFVKSLWLNQFLILIG